MFGWGVGTRGANIYKDWALFLLMALDIRNTSEADKTYDYAKIIKRKIRTIEENDKISTKNKSYISKFLQYCINESLSNARLSFYLDKLNVLALINKKDFDLWNKEDIELIVTKLNSKYDKAETRRAYIVTIKKFFRFVKNEENPELIKWIKTKNYEKTAKKFSEKEKEENILLPEEVESMIECAKHPRDRALLGVLYYSGCRVGELLALKIKDITFEDTFTSISVMGKTGFRKVPVNECTSMLKTWLEYHPGKNNKEAYLWINLQDLNRINNLKQLSDKQKEISIKNKKLNINNHIKIRYIAKLLNELGEKAKITKKVNPHNFRHSRLTALGLSGLDLEMIKKFAGHSKNSNITAQYTHYSDTDLKNSLNKIQGLEETEVKKTEMKKCFRCNHMNRNTLNVCENCGLTLDIKEGVKQDGNKAKEVKLTKVMKLLAEDPMFQKVLARYFLDKGMGEYVKDLADDEK